MGYSPWGRKESETTERLHFHFSFQQEHLPVLHSAGLGASPFTLVIGRFLLCMG